MSYYNVIHKSIPTKVLFAEHYTWQNFCLWFLRLVNNCVEPIYKMKKIINECFAMCNGRWIVLYYIALYLGDRLMNNTVIDPPQVFYPVSTFWWEKQSCWQAPFSSCHWHYDPFISFVLALADIQDRSVGGSENIGMGGQSNIDDHLLKQCLPLFSTKFGWDFALRSGKKRCCHIG